MNVHRRIAAVGWCVLAGACSGDTDTTPAPAAVADTAGLFLPPVAQPTAPTGPAHFTFAGLTPPVTFDSLRSRYPRSDVNNFFIYLDGPESHDGITGIGYTADAGGWRRLSISFEKYPGMQRAEPASQRYPRCARVLDPLRERYGQEDSSKQFADDTFARVDRYWNHPGELMVLLCILEREVYYARALTLERFPH